MARPSKLTEQVRSDLAAMVAGGATMQAAARAAGVGERTVRDWLEQGRESRASREQGGRITPTQRRYVELLEELERAEAQLQVRLAASVARAALEHWQASAWMLERRWPEDWAGSRRKAGRPPGSTSAPDRPNSQPEPPRVRLRQVT